VFLLCCLCFVDSPQENVPNECRLALFADANQFLMSFLSHDTLLVQYNSVVLCLSSVFVHHRPVLHLNGKMNHDAKNTVE